ncbi:hypothetical protein K438DRAFT_738789 [Mycena galopus ATCC 62051]|nr:hypothetical protein K438DRAFT_738789 [Mycena galopus ATCC 62051]
MSMSRSCGLTSQAPNTWMLRTRTVTMTSHSWQDLTAFTLYLFMSSPLARQQTRASILSWWSDSNPNLQGPTINIHTAAKPLCRFLYHRQALDFINQNRGSPLSPTILETYSSYFPYDDFLS